MGALAAAGWAGSARGETRYRGKWVAGLRGRCTASNWAQRAVRVDWGLSSFFKTQLTKRNHNN